MATIRSGNYSSRSSQPLLLLLVGAYWLGQLSITTAPKEDQEKDYEGKMDNSEDIVLYYYMLWCRIRSSMWIAVDSWMVPVYTGWVIVLLLLRYVSLSSSTKISMKRRQSPLNPTPPPTTQQQRRLDPLPQLPSPPPQGRHGGDEGLADTDQVQVSLEQTPVRPTINMTGSYQLVENINFEAFLAAQGVPWALRSAANRARPIHKLTQVGDVITIQICGIIDTPPTTYYINGPPSTCQVRGREFSDTVTYLEDGSGIQVLKHAVNDHYKVSVVRQLSPLDPNRLTLTSTAMFDAAYVDGPKDPIQSIQYFERILTE